MHPATYAAMSDPELNVQFRRRWGPPDPEMRERRPLERTALENQDEPKNFTIAALVRDAQRLRSAA
jgi:hypothetical protein